MNVAPISSNSTNQQSFTSKVRSIDWKAVDERNAREVITAALPHFETLDPEFEFAIVPLRVVPNALGLDRFRVNETHANTWMLDTTKLSVSYIIEKAQEVIRQGRGYKIT